MIPPRPPSEEDKQTSNRLNAAEALPHIEALQGNPDFAWFVANVLEKARDSERDRALDDSLSKADANKARHRHAALRKVCAELERLRSAHRKTLGMDKP